MWRIAARYSSFQKAVDMGNHTGTSKSGPPIRERMIVPSIQHSYWGRYSRRELTHVLMVKSRLPCAFIERFLVAKSLMRAILFRQQVPTVGLENKKCLPITNADEAHCTNGVDAATSLWQVGAVDGEGRPHRTSAAICATTETNHCPSISASLVADSLYRANAGPGTVLGGERKTTRFRTCTPEDCYTTRRQAAGRAPGIYACSKSSPAISSGPPFFRPWSHLASTT